MILEAMYNGEFYPCETVVPTSPEYRKAVICLITATHFFLFVENALLWTLSMTS